MSYEARWGRVLEGTRVGENRTETVYNFIVEFKREFDGNGPILREIVRMLQQLYSLTAVPDKKVGNFYVERLVSLGKIEIEGAGDSQGQRSPGRILLKKGCWVCREGASQGPEMENKSNHEAITGTVPEQDTGQPHRDLVGETSLL